MILGAAGVLIIICLHAFIGARCRAREPKNLFLWVAKLDSCSLCDVEVVGGTKYAHGLDSLSDCFPK